MSIPAGDIFETDQSREHDKTRQAGRAPIDRDRMDRDKQTVNVGVTDDSKEMRQRESMEAANLLSASSSKANAHHLFTSSGDLPNPPTTDL